MKTPTITGHRSGWYHIIKRKSNEKKERKKETSKTTTMMFNTSPIFMWTYRALVMRWTFLLHLFVSHLFTGFSLSSSLPILVSKREAPSSMMDESPFVTKRKSIKVSFQLFSATLSRHPWTCWAFIGAKTFNFMLPWSSLKCALHLPPTCNSVHLEPLDRLFLPSFLPFTVTTCSCCDVTQEKKRKKKKHETSWEEAKRRRKKKRRSEQT